MCKSAGMNSNDALADADLRIICGPTAAGKSAVAMELATRHGLTIVSADSRQIYRRFDIGTAKPSAEDQLRVTHLGIDVADPTERWSAARWAADANRAVMALGTDRTIVVGGTGFYLRALVEPLFEAPALDAARRAALQEELSGRTLDELRQWCQTLDPARAHLGRTQLLRAIEIALLTGRRQSELMAESEHQLSEARPSGRRVRWLVIDPGERLANQLEGRLDAMLASGWPEEVRDLAIEVPADAPAWQACGYAVVREYVEGARTLASARDAILIATRQYAKRQRTWFRNQLGGADVTRLDPHDATCDARVNAWWSGGDSA